MNTVATRKKLFIGAIPEAVERIRAVLATHYDLTIATSMAEVGWTALAEMDLLMCNLHFDEGKMFEFLVRVKADVATGSLPFLCVNSAGALSPALLRSVETASLALGITAFLDLQQWRATDGDAAAFRRLRAIIDDLTGAGAPATLHAGAQLQQALDLR